MKIAVAMPELKRIASSSPKSVGEVHSWSPDKYNANTSMVEIRRKGAYHDAPESLISIFHGINRYLVEQDAAMN